MKLKTLKDLKKYGDWTDKLVMEKDLREEAIKWVKEFRSKEKIYFDITASWFQKFFNITEDDLK